MTKSDLNKIEIFNLSIETKLKMRQKLEIGQKLDKIEKFKISIIGQNRTKLKKKMTNGEGRIEIGQKLDKNWTKLKIGQN